MSRHTVIAFPVLAGAAFGAIRAEEARGTGADVGCCAVPVVKITAGAAGKGGEECSLLWHRQMLRKTYRITITSACRLNYMNIDSEVGQCMSNGCALPGDDVPHPSHLGADWSPAVVRTPPVLTQAHVWTDALPVATRWVAQDLLARGARIARVLCPVLIQTPAHMAE